MERQASTRRSVLALIALCGGAQAGNAVPSDGAAEPTRKPAWAWTAEERLAARFDPAGISERAKPNRASHDQATEREHSGAVFDTLSGARQAELFLPSELFHLLIGRAFLLPPEARIEVRRAIESRAAALGYGRDLWGRLQRAAGPLLEPRTADSPNGPFPGNATHEFSTDGANLRRPVARDCRMRAEALDAAKLEFGEEPFLRFLYEAVAPDVFKTYPVDDEAKGQLLAIERGCR